MGQLESNANKRCEFPRVLFVTPCAFNNISGGGITFSNLFRGWPIDKLATITDDSVPVTSDVCNRFYFLTSDERRYISPFGKLSNATQGQANNNSSSPVSNTTRGHGTLRKVAKSIIGEAGIPDKGLLSDNLKKWIDDFRPTLVYSILGSIGYIDLVQKIVEEFKIPLVIHLMDDGVTDPDRKGIFGPYIRNRYRLKLLQVMSSSTLRIAIGEAMAWEYEKRYQYPFVHYQNTMDFEHCLQYLQPKLQIDDIPHLVYIGSVHSCNNLESLVDICKAVREINEQGTKVKFEMYVPEYMFDITKELSSHHAMIEVLKAPSDDPAFFSTLNNADVLILPVNFDDRSIKYIHLSMPTKVPAYLISGIPILVYGPPNVAQVDYAIDSRWGLVVEQRSQRELIKGIKRLVQDVDLRGRISTRAVEVAKQNHDSKKVRIAFRKNLTELVN